MHGVSPARPSSVQRRFVAPCTYVHICAWAETSSRLAARPVDRPVGPWRANHYHFIITTMHWRALLLAPCSLRCCERTTLACVRSKVYYTCPDQAYATLRIRLGDQRGERGETRSTSNADMSAVFPVRFFFNWLAEGRLAREVSTTSLRFVRGSSAFQRSSLVRGSEDRERKLLHRRCLGLKDVFFYRFFCYARTEFHQHSYTVYLISEQCKGRRSKCKIFGSK